MPPPGSSGGTGSGEFNTRNADDIIAEIFGSSMRYQSDGSSRGYSSNDNMFRNYSEGGSSSNSSGACIPKKPPPVESKLPCTLEELYSGSTRKMKISRTIIDANGRLKPITEILSITVKPGWKKGTKITFPDKGNEQPNQLPADLVFVIDEKPHEVFKRDGNNLLMSYTVTLAEALGGTISVKINTLGGRNLSIPVSDIISPTFELVVSQEGMPVAKDPGCHGDLKVKFEVKFPTSLTPEQKATIKRALGG